jgi:hypothetical protein
MRFSALVFALMIGLFFVAVQSVQACSCVGTGAPCQAFWNTPAVFSGQVEEVKTIIPESVLADGRKVYGPNRRVVRISVIEGFRGIEQQKSVETHTGGGGGDCGYDFQTGQKYLIYAYKNPELLGQTSARAPCLW